MRTDSSNSALAQQQLVYMLDDLSADEVAGLRTPDEIMSLSHLLRGLRERGSPFEQVPTEELPDFIELMLAQAKAQLPERACQAIGLQCVKSLNQTGGLVPTILARNHGACMAAINRQVNLRDPAFWGHGGKAFMHSVGREAVMDEIQAAGQTWSECPALFRMAHYWRLERSMQVLGKIEPQELPGVSVYQDQQSWTRQLVQAGPDIGAFLAGYITCIEPDEKRLCNLVVALGALDRLEGPMPAPEADVAQKWARTLNSYPPLARPWPNSQAPLIETGQTLLRRMALGQLAQGLQEQPRSRNHSLRI